MPFDNRVSKRHIHIHYEHVDNIISMDCLARFKHWSIYADYDFGSSEINVYMYCNDPLHSRPLYHRQIGHLSLYKTKHGYVVENIGIARKFQGQGIGFKTYLTLLKKGITIVSGETQSVGARKLWIKLLEHKKVFGGIVRPQGNKIYPVHLMGEIIESEIPVYGSSNKIVLRYA